MVQADVESANIVGYQYTEIKTGYSTFTPTFKQIGSDVHYLAEIIPQPTPSTQYATTAKKGTNGNIFIQLLSDGGSYSDMYKFYSNDPNGGSNYFKWYRQSGSTLTEVGPTDVPISDGTGFAIFNGLDAVTYLNVSGEVDTKAQNIAAIGFSMMGNATPIDMYLADIRPMVSATEQYATTAKKGTNGNIFIQLLNDGGSYSDMYKFYSNDPNGGSNYFKWYRQSGSTLTEVGSKEVPITAGMGFAIYNGTSAVSYIQLKKPLGE